jgi:hypothetical protein
MNEDDLFTADQEDRYLNRLRRSTRNTNASPDDDSGRGGESIGPFSPDYFNSIWEGR